MFEPLPDDVDLVRHLIADLNEDLPKRVAKFKLLTALTNDFGGTMLFGGHPSSLAYGEARSSFVNGNYVATIMLCQSLMEHLLAAYLHGTLMLELKAKQKFGETLKECQSRGLLCDGDVHDLQRLGQLRNPLAHYRNINDADHLDRRAMTTEEQPFEICEADAEFAIRTVIRLLGKPQFTLRASANGHDAA